MDSGRVCRLPGGCEGEGLRIYVCVLCVFSAVGGGGGGLLSCVAWNGVVGGCVLGGCLGCHRVVIFLARGLRDIPLVAMAVLAVRLRPLMLPCCQAQRRARSG